MTTEREFKEDIHSFIFVRNKLHQKISGKILSLMKTKNLKNYIFILLFNRSLVKPVDIYETEPLTKKPY